MAKLPTVIGLSLCEQIVIEEKTHNVTLVNCFTRRTLDYLPSETPFVVFALLTGGMGDIELDVVIQRLDTLDEIHRVSFSGRFESPLRTMRCKVRIRDCYFPEPGRYVASLRVAGEIVAELKFHLLLKE